MLTGAVPAAIGFALSADKKLSVPLWAWVLLGLAGVFYAQFLVFHAVRHQRDCAHEVINRLNSPPNLSSSVRVEPSPNDERPLIRLALLNSGGQVLPAGQLVNIIYPASWSVSDPRLPRGIPRPARAPGDGSVPTTRSQRFSSRRGRSLTVDEVLGTRRSAELPGFIVSIAFPGPLDARNDAGLRAEGLLR